VAANLPLNQLPAHALYMLPGNWAGLARPGNIDLLHRPQVRHDGGISTVLSTSFQDPRSGYETLVPQVVGNRVVSPTMAWQHYLTSGQNLGQFLTAAAANAYAEALHRQQAAYYGIR